MSFVRERCSRRRTVQRWAACLSISLFSFACRSSTDEEPRSLEVFSWWVNPGESAALDAVLGAFQEEYTNTKVVRASPSTPALAANQMRSRMISGSPPDVFQSFGGGEVLRWVLNNGEDDSASLLEPISIAPNAASLTGVLPAFVRNSLGVGTNLYAVPLDIPRFNVLFYNKRVLANNSLKPPTTLDEIHQIAAALKPKGIAPIAIGARDGSVVSQLLFDAVLISQSGVAFRDSYLRGNENPTDPRIQTALTEVTALLAETNQDRHLLDWTSAARTMIDGSSAMTLVGDWAKAFFVSAGLEPDVDFGVVPFPGTQGVFVYGIGAFSMPRGSSSPEAALDFIDFLATRKASDIFSAEMGTSPARIDTDRTRLDVIARRTLDELSSSTLTPARVTLIQNYDLIAELDSTLRLFSENGDQTAVLNTLRSRYDQF
jgi:glucose/mannose transport system substrate-binding protein